MFRHLCLLAAVASALCAGPSRAADEAPESERAKAKLADIRRRISAITQHLGDELQRRDALAARLREADIAITGTRRRLDAERASLVAAERRRTELRAGENRARQALDVERAALGAEARAAYMNGGHEQLRLLFTQNDPAAAGRMSAYYRYIARDRERRILAVNEQVEKLRSLGMQVEDATARLQTLQRDTSREVNELERAQAERFAALTAVARQVKTGSEELAQLKREELAEEALVADLALVLQDLPVDGQQKFEALRGKLSWPVVGRLAATYQEPRRSAAAGPRWNGVLIEAKPGAKVRAPYFGRVVYADWLQGLGLLIIIGHSGDFMTLYGRAEVIYKSVGDWVSPGDVIAALSDAGGPAPQLYFEIRDGRKTVDPQAWLTAVP